MMFLIRISLRFVFFHFIFFPPGWTSVSFNSSHNLELIPSDKMLLRTKELELRGARVAPAAAASVRFLVCKLPLALQQTQPWTNMGGVVPQTTTLASVFPKKKLG